MFLDQVANPSAPLLGQLGRMRGGEYRMRWMMRQIPGRKQHAAIGRLGRAGRHEHNQPIDLTAGNPDQPRHQQAMMRCRLVIILSRPRGKPRLNLSPPQEDLEPFHHIAR